MTTQPLHEVTLEPGDEFFSGAAPEDAPTDYTTPVSLAGRGFILDRSPELSTSLRHSRQSVQLLNTQQANSGADQSQTQPEVWRRNIESWHQGSGQLRYDRTDGLPYRYSRSHNIDVWDEWRMSLLPETTNLRALAAGRAFLTTVGPNRLFAAVGDQGYWWTDLAVAETVETLPAVVLDCCSDGEALYTIDSGGTIRRHTAPGSVTTFATVPGFTASGAMIRFIKGFLVVATGNTLYDMTSATARLIFIHPIDNYRWVDGCEGLNVAYLLGGMGDKWHVYGMTINEEATSFDPPTSAAPLPEGEIGYALGSYLGYVLIGSNTGWRFGIPAGDGNVTFGRLVQTDTPVRCFEGQDRFVWFGQSATSGQFSGLGRADLSTFIAPMTPASADDLTTTSYGVVRAVTTFGAGPQRAGARVFCVEGVGVFAEQPTLAATGYLEQGSFSFNSSDQKMGLYAQLFTAPILGGKVLMDVRYNDGEWEEVGSMFTDGATSMGNVKLERQFANAEVRFRLERDADNHTVGPTVNRMEFRALNIPGRATQFVLPLMLFDSIEVEGSEIPRRVEEDHQFLMDLVETRRAFTYREGNLVWTLYATDFLWLPEQKTLDGRTYQGLYVMTAKEFK